MKTTINVEDISQKLRQFANERDWNQFHSPKNLAMAVSVEASELLEIFQWLNETQSLQPNEQQRTNIQHEVADVMLYLLRLCDVLNIDIATAIDNKMMINNARYPAEKVKGSAKKYTEYL